MNNESFETKQLSLFSASKVPAEIEPRPVRDDFNFCRLALFVPADKDAQRFRNIRQSYKVDVDGQTLDVVSGKFGRDK